VSCYTPLVRAGPEMQQNPIRLKNAVRLASLELSKQGLDEREAERMLAPMARLSEDYEFLQHPVDTLAVFVADERLEIHRIPVVLPELLVVGARFHVKPLLTLVDTDRPFHVLTLDQHGVALYSATRFDIREVDLGDTPRTLEDALGHELTDPSLQVHSGVARPGSNRRVGVYHTQGGGKDEAKRELEVFFHRVDQGIVERLRTVGGPLVLAGVEYLLAIYRGVNSYAHLMDEVIEGTPKLLSGEQLHRRAWAIAEPAVFRDREAALSGIDNLVAVGKASRELATVVLAAYDGRVETLVVALDEQRWGTIDVARRRVKSFLTQSDANGVDLLDVAAAQTLLHAGTVFPLPRTHVLANSGIAAVFRY